MMNSMEQISKTFSRLFESNNSGKGEIGTEIKCFQQTVLMAMINTPDIIIRNIYIYSFVTVKHSAVK